MTNSVRLLFVGDIGLGGDYATRYGHGPQSWTQPFDDVVPVFKTADLRIGNLESPLHLGSTPRPKRNLLGTRPDSVAALNHLGFDVLSLGNNHITDQGAEGITKTREILESNGIAAFGAGRNLKEARRPAIAEAKGLSFAFLGYAVEGQDVGAEMATDSREGCVPLSIENIEVDMASAREMADHVVVSLHWGYQYDRYPDPDQIVLAREIIDLGATVVHGHHPHVLQGMERYKDGLILYSLGNFFFSDFVRTDGQKVRFPQQAHNTATVVCDFGESGLQGVSMTPVETGVDLRMRLLEGPAAKRSEKSFVLISERLDRPGYSDYWRKQHRRTNRLRRKLDLNRMLLGDVARLWGKIRRRGIGGSLKSIRGHHAKGLVRLFGRYFRFIQR